MRSIPRDPGKLQGFIFSGGPALLGSSGAEEREKPKLWAGRGGGGCWEGGISGEKGRNRLQAVGDG